MDSHATGMQTMNGQAEDDHQNLEPMTKTELQTTSHIILRIIMNEKDWVKHISSSEPERFKDNDTNTSLQSALMLMSLKASYF